VNIRLFAVLLMALLTLPEWGYGADHAILAKAPFVIHFMSKEEASRALSDGKSIAYYQSLNLGEMRAKTGLALEAVTVENAREITRTFYASETLEFTSEESAAIQALLRQLYPFLEARAAAYITNPWCFIKTSVRIEGGLPHTRGDCIVLSPSVLDEFVLLRSQNRTKELFDSGANLLVHEQTHVLQRKYPDRFTSLYVKHLGFRHMVPAPGNNWMRDVGVVNPDAPDTGWAYPVSTSIGQQWIMPYLVLKPSAHPVMPEDFITLGITVQKNDRTWKLSDASPTSIRQLVMDFFAYAKQFPNPDQAYHPNELTADILAAWLSNSNALDLQHPISVATLAWAKIYLQ
jgi:hypothetical protein